MQNYWLTTFYFSQLLLALKYHQPQPAITCSKLTIEALEQGVKYIQS